MVKKQPAFWRRLQNLLTNGLWGGDRQGRPYRRRRSLILTALLFVLSIGLPQIVAKVSASTPIVQTQQTPYALVEQGKALYQAGKFQEASAVWQQAAAAFAAETDVLNQAMALSNLGLTYQQLGQWDKAKSANNESLNLLQTQPTTKERSRIIAQTLDIQGQLQLETGQSESALETWQKAADIYTKIGDKDRMTQSLINQAQAMQALGLSPRACKTLLEALEFDNQECAISTEELQTLKNQPASELKVRAMSTLGDVLRVVGNLEQSKMVLSESLKVAQQLGQPQDIGSAYLSLGNTARDLAEKDAAFNYYNEAQQLSTSAIAQCVAQLNQLSLLLESNKWSEAENLWPDLKLKVDSLPPSRTGVYAQINLAQSLIKLLVGEGQLTADKGQLRQDIDEILAKAAEQARILGDKRAEAYALGDRGLLYEKNQEWVEAENFTQQALNIAPTYNAPDIAYQFLWQSGRIRKARGDIKGAIANYTSAVNTLQSLRSDLVTISSDVQFSFRESVEPLYRELVGLLLAPGSKVEQSDLIQARNVIESLQLAELDNFFRDACLDAKPAQIDKVDPTAAVLYTIILSDRLVAIAALPGQPLRHYTTSLPQEEIEATLKEMRNSATDPRLRRSVQRFFEPSQKVYDWLIRPIEADLASSGVKNLVFVLDGGLRNIPIAALYDGKQYIIQKYSVAIAPGLQLVDPQPLEREKIEILTAGLSEARQGFAELPNVQLEVEQIEAEVRTKILLNQSFTTSNFKATVKSFPFSVVHIATHGEFSSQAEKTFILTWDDRINAKELDKLLRADTQKTRPIELLVLSACRTAVGDKRAALGLAGVAVRAGARSTVASLWYVSDESTAKLMSKFYEELANTKVGKGEALRLAQQALLQDEKLSHPYFWAAFVLVGNWL